MDKTYDVIIDRSSTTVSVIAENKEDASKKAYKIYLDNFIDDFESWIADVDEIKKEDKYWIIRNINNNTVWNNSFGWLEDFESSITIFDQKEKEEFNLPIEGKWVCF